MSATTIDLPDSGIQLILLVGAAFVLLSVNPSFGYTMIFIALAAWGIYNVLNIARLLG